MRGVYDMGMISDKMRKKGIFGGVKLMKGKPVLYLFADGPEIIKVKVTGTINGSAVFGQEVNIEAINCELKFSQFENSFFEAESLRLVPVLQDAAKAA
jgi:hypothetical protein